MRGHASWHIRVDAPRGGTRHFWVDKQNWNIVHRCKYSDENQYTVIESYLDKGGGIPTVTEMRQYIDDKVVSTMTVRIQDHQFNIPVDPSAWTLAGLEMPIGEPITDYRVHRIIGHWDGKMLLPEFMKVK